MTALPDDARSLAHAAHKRLARTVNLGPDFGAPLERGWTIEVTPAHLEACARNGFTAIRLDLLFLTGFGIAALAIATPLFKRTL